MAVETIITFELSRYGIKIPERVFVKINSLLTFRIAGAKEFIQRNDLSNTRITLYFPIFVPEGFKNVHTAEVNNERDEIEIASGVVQSLGEYKYGVNMESNGEKVFDEDPYIIVYI